jgi:hypothetical protein
VDAPAGMLTDEHRAALLECKPVLLGFLARQRDHQEPENANRRFAMPGRAPTPATPLPTTPWRTAGTTSPPRTATRPSSRWPAARSKGGRREGLF